MRYQIDNLPSQIDFESKGFVQRTLQNAKNLLMCHMGEVPYGRLRGFNPALYDLPIGDLKNELLPELDRIMLWEPDAEVVSADAELLEGGTIYITAVIEIGGST